MAPSLEEPAYSVLEPQTGPAKVVGQNDSVTSYEPGRTLVEAHDDYPYDKLKPAFPEMKLETLSEHFYHDKGTDGDANFRNLLADATDVFDYTPKIGTEVSGIQLSKLTARQKDDLARLVATRGVVFFRNQQDFDIDAQLELGRYFGRLHVHATAAVPEKRGLEEALVVWRGDGSKDMRAVFTPTFQWHADVAAQHQC